MLGDLPSPREERQAGPQWGLKEMYTSISGLNTISDGTCLGVTRTINIEFIYRVFGREITRYTVIFVVYIRFWPRMCHTAHSYNTPYRLYTTRTLPY